MNIQQPNIIFICADQWRGDCLGLYQNQHPVVTPHINQLAREGTNYTRAYATCPVCMPQRMTMLTGRSESSLGLLTNFMNGPRPEIEEDSTIAGILGRTGYHTQAVGKMHFYPDRARWGFDNVVLHPNDYVNFLEDNGYGGAYRGHGLGGNEVYPGVFPAPEKFYHTNWIVEESIRFLDRREPDCPFFLSVIFEAPHSPFDPPAPYDRFYDNFSIPAPVIGSWNNGDEYPPDFSRKRLTGKYNDLSPETIAESRRRYYGQITNIDYQLGRLLGALKTRNLDTNTAIIFTSDHGELLGDHGLFAKYCYLEGAARVPLIVRPPQAMSIDCAVSSGTPVMTTDIMPTILDVVGLSIPSEVEGISLLGDVPDNRTVCGETYSSAFIVDNEYKYVYYQNGGVEQLFNPVQDPDDLYNLSNLPEHRVRCEKLRDRLIDYLATHNSAKVRMGELVREDLDFDEKSLSAINPSACRGPMRFGAGY
ncbi:MAG: sulfatase-like hydrolase/transferase [Victivallaceae bacterium]|nr:sulfatase-like hydrolase/transferase [Victivallaceae bacterium]